MKKEIRWLLESYMNDPYVCFESETSRVIKNGDMDRKEGGDRQNVRERDSK